MVLYGFVGFYTGSRVVQVCVLIYTGFIEFLGVCWKICWDFWVNLLWMLFGF